MAYNFNAFKDESKNIEEWLRKEYDGIRTSRATPAVLDTVSVESYGARMPIKQVATINVEGPRTIRIVPFDASQVKAVEKAIIVSNLGLSVGVDDKGVRVSFPELTAERREQLIKLAKERLEHSRVSVRKVRDTSIKDIEAKEKEGGMGEDEKKRIKTELQKMVDALNQKLLESFEKKETEIMS
jgi:ribosome recycling factor